MAMYPTSVRKPEWRRQDTRKPTPANDNDRFRRPMPPKQTPEPANDNYRNARRAARIAFGRAVRGAGRFHPYARAWDAAEVVFHIATRTTEVPLGYPVPNPGNGWYLYHGPCETTPGPYTSGSGVYLANTLNPCLSGQSMTSWTALNEVHPPNPSHYSWSLWRWNQNMSIKRFTHKVSYRRDTNTTNNDPALVEGTKTEQSQAPAVFHNPFEQTYPWEVVVPELGDPMAAPPLPSRAPTMRELRVGRAFQSPPVRDFWFEPSTRPESPTRANPAPGEPAVETPPVPGVQPGTRPGPAPGTSVTVKPSHKRKPPGPRTKERKSRARAMQEFVGNVFGGFTEFNDAVSAAHKALPPEFRAVSWYKGRRVQPSWKKKWDAVYKHFDKVDMNEFVWNLAEDHVQDELIGRTSGGANKFVNKGSGVSVNKFRQWNNLQV